MRKEYKAMWIGRRALMVAAVSAFAALAAVPQAHAAEEPTDITTAGGVPLPMSIGDGATSGSNASVPSIAPPTGVDPLAMPGAAPIKAPVGDDDPLAWGDEEDAPSPAPAPVVDKAPAPQQDTLPGLPAPKQAAPKQAAPKQADKAPKAAPAGLPNTAPKGPGKAAQKQHPDDIGVPALPGMGEDSAKADAGVEMPVADKGGDDEKAPVAQTASSGDVSALEGRIATLEKKLSEVESGLVSKEAFESLKKEVGALRKDMESSPAPAAKKAAAPAAKKSSSAESASKKPAEKKAAAPPAAKPVKWVLKAAKPGMAWVSEAGSGEMRTISVGETLPGIGKIVSVASDSSGKWTISGTKGKVEQGP